MRIALGGITHEANTFCPYVAGIADFYARQLARGDEILADWQSTRTEQAGALTVLTAQAGCTILPTIFSMCLTRATFVRWTVRRKRDV